MPHCFPSELLTPQELDNLPVRAGDEGDPHLRRRIAAKLGRPGWDPRRRAGCQRPLIGHLNVRNAQAEMQQRAFRRILVGTAAAAFRLHGGTRAENLDVAAVARVQERRPVDSARLSAGGVDTSLAGAASELPSPKA